MTPDAQTLHAEIDAAIDAARDECDLEALRVSTLGKKGSVSKLLRTLGSMKPEERKTAGAELNKLRDEVARNIEARRTVLAVLALEAQAWEKVESSEMEFEAHGEKVVSPGTILLLSKGGDRVVLFGIQSLDGREVFLEVVDGQFKIGGDLPADEALLIMKEVLRHCRLTWGVVLPLPRG